MVSNQMKFCKTVGRCHVGVIPGNAPGRGHQQICPAESGVRSGGLPRSLLLAVGICGLCCAVVPPASATKHHLNNSTAANPTTARSVALVRIAKKIPKHPHELQKYGNLTDNKRQKLFGDLPAQVAQLLGNTCTNSGESANGSIDQWTHDTRLGMNAVGRRLDKANHLLSPEQRQGIKSFVVQRSKITWNLVLSKMGVVSEHQVAQDKKLAKIGEYGKKLRADHAWLTGQQRELIEGLLVGTRRLAGHFHEKAEMLAAAQQAWQEGHIVPENEEQIAAAAYAEAALRSNAVQAETIQCGLVVALENNDAMADKLTVLLDQKLPLHTSNMALEALAADQASFANKMNQLDHAVVVGPKTISALREVSGAVRSMHQTPTRIEHDVSHCKTTVAELQSIRADVATARRPWSPSTTSETASAKLPDHESAADASHDDDAQLLLQTAGFGGAK